MRSSRRGNLLLRNLLARGECAVRILFYHGLITVFLPIGTIILAIIKNGETQSRL